MKLLEKFLKKAYWKTLREETAFAGNIRFLKEMYRETKEIPLPALSPALRGVFHETGSRKEFEIPYFKRRKYLSSLALLTLLYPEDDGYLKELEAVLSATLEEYSWALPAHTDTEDAAPKETFIDLFSAETGFAVSEICYLLSDRLSPAVLARARQEVERRIIRSYRNRTFWWETDESNWASVCAGNVLGCFLYLAPECFEEIFPRVQRTLRCFLASFPADGTCLEGFHYWHFGFGEFVWIADLLLSFTDGEVDCFADEKVEKIAGYAQRSFLMGNATVSVSDGERQGVADVALIHYLARRYPKSVHPLSRTLMRPTRGNVGWLQLSRLFFYYDPAIEEESPIMENCDLPCAGQVIVHTPAYSLAVKAGHNGEPHNHNDVGSFILATKCGQVFADLGAEAYNREYFQEETRYLFLSTSSRGHSVPIVNGKYQRAGRNFGGDISHEKKEIRVSFARAYGQKSFTGLKRTFAYGEHGFTVTDEFSPDYSSLTERFILLSPPKIDEKYVRAENVILRFDPARCSPSLTTEERPLHEAENGKTTETVYLLDFALQPALSEIRFTFEIKL